MNIRRTQLVPSSVGGVLVPVRRVDGARLSHATISAVLAGRALAEKSLALIAKALSRAPVLEVVDSLIMRDRFDTALD